MENKGYPPNIISRKVKMGNLGIAQQLKYSNQCYENAAVKSDASCDSFNCIQPHVTKTGH